MRLEGDCKCRLAMGLAHLERSRDHRAVAEMDAVEIAHGHHSPLGDGSRWGCVADNGKSRRHFRKVLQEFLSSMVGRTVPWWRRRSQAAAIASKRMQSGSARLTGCLTPDARGGEGLRI